MTRKLTTREGGTNRTIAKNTPKIENARDRSPWRLNLDGLVVQPVLRPPAPPVANLQLSPPLPPLAAPVSSLQLSSDALPPARPGTNPPARIGVFSPGSTGGKHPIFTVYYALPIDWRLTLQLALASLLQLGLRSLPIHTWRRPSARFFSNRRLHRLPPIATPAACLRLASAVTPSGFAGLDAPSLRRAPLPPVGPSMHPLASIEPCIDG